MSCPSFAGFVRAKSFTIMDVDTSILELSQRKSIVLMPFGAVVPRKSEPEHPIDRL